MGWWSTGIMGGDTPLDFKGEFEDKFGSSDPEFNQWRVEDGKEPIPFIIPTAEQTIEFISQGNAWGDADILAQVVGFLVMERGAPMNDVLRAQVLLGIENETDVSGWSDPGARKRELDTFRKLVFEYPSEGKAIEMPHQPGLFEQLSKIIP